MICARPDRKRVLFLSYVFPPVGGAGVQRPLKFVKYLGDFGWDVSLVVASNPSVPLRDESLAREIPPGVKIYGARTLEPSYQRKQELVNSQHEARGILHWIKSSGKRMALNIARCLLQPEPQVLWLPDAIDKARKVLLREKHDAIFATAPPYSNLVLGSLLKRQFGLPLVLDFRDEWDLSSRYLEHAQRDPWSLAIQRWLQGEVLTQADAIVATTQASTNQLLTTARLHGGCRKGTCIYNGYDEPDFEGEIPLEKQDTFRLVYVGTLWNLTSIEPLVKAVTLLKQRAPQIASKLEVRLIGRKTPDQTALVERLKESCSVVSLDYCEHTEATRVMQSADALLLVLSDVPGADRVVSAKLFEYLAARRPILSLLPKGESMSIVRNYWPEGTFRTTETDAISRWLEHEIESRPTHASPGGIEQFSRRSQTRQLAELLDSVSATRNLIGASP